MSDELEYFPTSVILSVVYDRLLCKIDDVYRILNFVTGDSIYTHQIPRACRTVSPWILQGLPQLRDWKSSEINTQNWQSYVKLASEKFGERLLVKKMPRSMWTHIDAVEEAKAMVGDENVIALNVEPGERP